MRTMPSSRSSTSSAKGVPRCIANPRPKWASWYRFAPVDTIQSMKPASMRGIMVDMPRPAGVIAPVRLIPTVTSSASINSVNSRHPSARRPALYARNALSTNSATVSRPLIGLGSMRGPRRKSFRVMVPSGVALRLEGGIGPGPALAGLPHELHGLRGAVGNVQQVEILRGDLPLPRHPVAQPVGEALPVLPAEENDREVLHLAGLDQRERLEQLVHRAVTAGKHDERGRVLHEHRLADEKVAEVDRPLHVRVETLLVRQLDVAADGQPVAFLTAAIRGLHDPRAAAGDDREPFLREHARGLDRLCVVGILGRGARGPEDGDGAVDVGERVESLDELSHDSQYPPRVGPGERAPLPRDLREESFVLSDRGALRAARAL